MMPYWEEYLQPRTVDEALSSLAEHAGSTAIVAGGTDLLLDLQQGRRAPVEALIDVTRIDELSQIYLKEDYVFLGASATHDQIRRNPLLQEHAEALVEACGLIGGPQVRNVGTIGGNVAHALPAGDGSIALLALDAKAEIATVDSRRMVNVEDLFKGPGQTTLSPGRDLLVGFRLPMRGDGEGSSFYRVMRPQGVAIAILNMGVWLKLSEDGTLSDVRLAAGPAGPRPLLGRRTAAYLRGRKVNEATIAEATATFLEEMQLRTSPHRASHAYRTHIVSVLLERTLRAALQRAQARDQNPARDLSVKSGQT